MTKVGQTRYEYLCESCGLPRSSSSGRLCQRCYNPNHPQPAHHEGIVWEYDIPNIGVVKVPLRWLGRRSKLGDYPAVNRRLVAEATGLSRSSVDEILAGRQRPYQGTVDVLATIGIVIPHAYTQRDRTMPVVRHRCKICRKAYTSPHRQSRFCSPSCAMQHWHKRQIRERRCGWCGKPADGKYAFTCKVHDPGMRRNHLKCAADRRQKYEEEGRCISCSVLPAREIAQTCILCYRRSRSWRREKAAEVKAERRRRGLIDIAEATRILGYAHILSVHNLISKGRLVIAETSGKKNKRFYVARDEVERYQVWRGCKPTQTFVPVHDPSQLMLSIKRVLPEGLPDGVADDATSAIMLDILENKIEISQISDSTIIAAYIREAYKWQGDLSQVSIDKPLNEDGFTLADILGEEDEALEAATQER